MSLIAVFMPLLVIVALAVLALAAWWALRKVRRFRARKRSHPAG
jgi:hypothetical protein